MVLDAFVGAVQQAGCHGPAQVGAAEPFVEHHLEHGRQTLAAVLGRARQRRPAGLPEGLVGRARAGRHGHCAILEARADLVAVAVQRRDHLADELAGFFQHLAQQVGVGVVGQRRQLGQAVLGLQHVKQDEADVGGLGAVGVHGGALDSMPQRRRRVFRNSARGPGLGPRRDRIRSRPRNRFP
jgi:hypothetical protein